jgi:hypothetical protein
MAGRSRYGVGVQPQMPVGGTPLDQPDPPLRLSLTQVPRAPGLRKREFHTSLHNRACELTSLDTKNAILRYCHQNVKQYLVLWNPGAM